MEVRLVSVSVAVTSAIVMLPLSSEAFTRAACTSAAWMPPTFELIETSCASMRVAWHASARRGERDRRQAGEARGLHVADPRLHQNRSREGAGHLHDGHAALERHELEPDEPVSLLVGSFDGEDAVPVGTNETLRRSFVQYSTWKASSSVGSKRMLWHPS